MNKRQGPSTEAELVHAVADLFNAVEPDTPEEIDTTLRDAGHDHEAIAARMQDAADRAKARARGVDDD